MPFHRLARSVLLVVAWAVAVSAVAASSLPLPQRIVAIGDLHGDHRAWRDIAAAAGLVDRAGRWAGGRTVVVQVGDVPDRGPDSLRIMRELRRLQAEAPRAGGKVIALVGNHEAMNVTGDLRYVHPGEYAAFRGPRSQAVRDDYYSKHRRSIEEAARRRAPDIPDVQIRADWERATPLGMIEHRRAWHPTGEVGAWVVRNPAVARLGDLVFVHGGISAAYAGWSIDDINRRVAKALAEQDGSDDAIINDENGPLWYRGLVARDDGAAGAVLPSYEELREVLRKQKARAIIVGHTPALKGIALLHDGRLVQIDTGISSHYGGTLSYLEIIGGRMVPRTVQRSAGGAPGR